ncbi:class I SAM-dependent methyltransferase [Luteimonas deserti]|uniref:Class I SAM-dependent methyltransferase n=1 Tax=Luteimonas deserti TaxID=2752306 RepID=A0A7Z0TYX0_9GAMM|nr:class I SAM-dependent methyltransferase [Luteimonas deserti]NYZ62827.1 class I SAM-dependent methyltransferase [Luteimonas deserti]
MQLRNLGPSSSSDGWDRKWADIFDHYQNDLRHAYYIHAMLERDERHVLEIAAGSFRDMAELRRRGIDCEGMDFSKEAVTRAKQHFPDFSSAIHHASAFALPFADNAFDGSYHNGFWVLFSDAQIKELASEQARVSRARMIATVHNAHNKQFVDYFERKKASDPLYDIRFFEMEQMVELMRAACSEVAIIPVGKGKQHHEDILIKNGVTDPAVLRTCLRESGLAHLETSERLLCIGTVKS